MKLYKGWLRLEKDEELNVELLEIKRTSNNKPYAVCKTKEEQFNVNIAERDTTRKQGKYKLYCTNVTIDGYCFVEFKEFDSWDIHDEVMEELETQQHDNITLEALRVSIRLTREYTENMEYTTPTIQKAIETIQSELYKDYGQMLWRREQ